MNESAINKETNASAVGLKPGLMEMLETDRLIFILLFLILIHGGAHGLILFHPASVSVLP